MTGPALDPEVRELLNRLSAMGMRPYPELGVLRARGVVESSRWMQGDKADVRSVRDVLVGGAAGLLPARVYDPQPGAVLPLVVYFHGGGWVTGSVAVADRPCRALALAAQCVVVSVDYRLAPETPFPGPAEDCFAALSWLAAHAPELNADVERLAVVGDSAGANLAAATTLMARDRGGPAISYQVLMYPCLLPTAGSPFASYRDNADGYMLTRDDMEWFWAHYLPLGTDAADSVHPYAAPLRAAHLRDLPPATVVTAQFDPLRDEGNAYAQRLRDDGVVVDLVEWPGAIHGFFWMAGELALARELVGWVGEELRGRLR
jgi:acetyl esterase